MYAHTPSHPIPPHPLPKAHTHTHPIAPHPIPPPTQKTQVSGIITSASAVRARAVAVRVQCAMCHMVKVIPAQSGFGGIQLPTSCDGEDPNALAEGEKEGGMNAVMWRAVVCLSVGVDVCGCGGVHTENIDSSLPPRTRHPPNHIP